jgi:hypothetical protein
MLDFAASWVEIPKQTDDRYFSRYPEESIADWRSQQQSQWCQFRQFP